jgi:uncharacterized membrane protein (UPF0127 family)
VLNLTNGAVLAERAVRAALFHERFFGLLGRTEIGAGEGLIISCCGAVHTMFMRVTIDALFFLESGEVAAVFSRLRPWRFAWPGIRGASVLELPAGTVEETGTCTGHRLEFQGGSRRS